MQNAEHLLREELPPNDGIIQPQQVCYTLIVVSIILLVLGLLIAKALI